MPSQDYMTDDSSNRCFECSKMQLFEPMCESSDCPGEEWSVFGDWFLGRQLASNWLCTTQNWLFCVVLSIWLRHVQFFRKNRPSCAWKSFVREHLLLVLAYLETPIRLLSTFGLIDVFRSTVIVFLEHFSRPIDTSLFLTIDKLCGIQREQIFLTVKSSCNIEYTFTVSH